MAVDFANVNISLAEFQGISSGKYNAGEVKLASETKLGKVNNHVHFQGSNATPLSHEEVLAVKNAFVKALSSNGVAADEIARIRRELGLSAETGIDKTLHARSIRPLTRQQVRDILDRNAAAINAHADQVPGAARISTSAQIYGEGGMRADRAATRNEVNAALAGAGGTEEHEGIALAEAVISGDVDFCFDKDTKYLLAQAHAQIGQILQRSHGRPSAEREAVIEFHLNETGQLVSIRTGQSEAAFVRKLEEMVIRLANGRPRDPRGAAVRAEFGALATAQARLDWINGLGNAPDAGFKLRTAVIMMLTEGGIDDWETLSRINRVDDGIARDFARSLAQLNGTLRGDALRNDQAMLSLANLAAREGAVDVPQDRRAVIPATSPEQWNRGIRDAIGSRHPERIPHDIKALLDEAPGHVRRLFGEDAVDLHATGVGFVAPRVFEIIPDNMAEPATAENIRAALFAYAEKRGAEAHARTLIGRALVAAGGSAGSTGKLWSDWSWTRPQLRERLSAARSAAEIDAAFDELREEIASDAKRLVAVERNLRKDLFFFRDALATRMGLPPACLSTGIDLQKFHVDVVDLVDRIRRGEIHATTDAEVEAAVRTFAERRAAQYAEALAKVEGMPDLPPALRDALLEHVIAIDSPQKLDVARVVAAARERLAARAAAIDAALVPGADKRAVYEEMRLFVNEYTQALRDLFPQGKPVGAEEDCSHGSVLLMTSILDREGFVGRLAAFFARPDVKNDDFYNNETTNGVNAYAAYRFVTFLPKPDAKAELASSLGTPDMRPIHAQALMRAFEDAGLRDLPAAERMAVLRPTHPAGAALAQAIVAEPGPVPPHRLRELAAQIFHAHVVAGGFALPAADVQRRNAALAKYDGGLPAADKARLRQYAESLDFSEAAAPASEKALARYLDEICGGGAFANPASSASRRALVDGHTLADLPTLSLVADLLVDESALTMAQAVDKVLDRQGAFRRNWDAALLSLAGNRPDRVATLPAEDKAAVARAILLCKEDADLVAVVTSGISRAIRDGAGHLRNPVAIQRIVEDVAANIAELREAAADDPAALAAGMDLLKGLETRRVPAGYVKHLLAGARLAPLDAVVKLRGRSSAADIHAAILQLNRNATSILAGRDSEGVLDDGDASLACRHFLLRTMVSRLTESQRRGLRDALASQNAVQTAAFYGAVAADGVEMPAEVSLALHERITNFAAALSREAGFLYGVVRRSLGEANAAGQLPALQGALNLAGIGARTMFAGIQAAALADSREITINRDAMLFRRLVSGDIDGLSELECQRIAEMARRKLDAIREKHGGNPPAGDTLRATWRLPSGQIVEVATCGSTAAFANHLEDMLFALANRRKEGNNGIVPTLSDADWNEALLSALLADEPARLPHDVAALEKELLAEARAKFGADVIPPDARFRTTIYGAISASYNQIAQAAGHRLGAEDLRATFREELLKYGAMTLAGRRLEQAAAAAGVERIATADKRGFIARNPDLLAAIGRAGSPAEVARVLDEAGPAFAKMVGILGRIRSNLATVGARAAAALAAKTGLPAASLATLECVKAFDTKANAAFASKLVSGKEVVCESEQDVDAAFAAEIDKFSKGLPAALDKAEGVFQANHIPPEAAGAIRAQICHHGKFDPKVYDIEKFPALADKFTPLLNSLLAALADRDVSKEDGLLAIEVFITSAFTEFGKQFPDMDDQSERFNALCTALTIMFKGDFSAAAPLVAFLERADVARALLFNQSATALDAVLRTVKGQLDPKTANDALLASLGTPKVQPHHAAALVKAARDAGLTAASEADILALFAPGKPAGTALAEAVAASPALVTPQLLQSLAAGVLRAFSGAIHDGVASAALSAPEADFPPEARAHATSAYAKAGNEPWKADALVAAAFGACGDDAELRAHVLKYLDRILVGGNAQLRSEASVRADVAALAANFAELRQLAANDPELLRHGRDLLDSLHGKAFPNGLIGRIVQTAREQPTDALKGLSARSKGMAIHKAVSQFYGNIVRVGRDSGVDDVITGPDEAQPCREFVMRRMLASLRPADREGLYAALHSPNGMQIFRGYSALAQFVGNRQVSDADRGALNAIGNSLRVQMLELNASLCCLLGRQHEPIQALDGDPEPPETYGAAGLVDDVLVLARARVEAKMQEAVGRYVKGTGAAAERLHGVVEARIRTDPASPDTVVMNAHQLVVGPMLNHTIVMDMQSFATGQQTQFDLDRHRQFTARLVGVGEVSEDPAVARDQFARFVTKNPSATYASLDPVTRNKANFAMTLVSQGTHNAVLFGFGVALDPDRSTANVSFALTGDPERSFELKFDVNGGLNLRFRARQKATAVVTSVDATPCGPGSEVTSKLDLHVNAEELDRIGGVDFAAYDDRPIAQIINDTRPENKNKYVKAKFAIPERFRLAIDVGPSLVADLK